MVDKADRPHYRYLSLPPDGLLRFSWLLEEELAVGPAPRSYVTLQALGFHGAISLQEDLEPGPHQYSAPEGFHFLRVPIKDGITGGVPTVEQVERAVGGLRDFLESGAVYVHCYAGVGRSPAACIAYLAAHRGMSLEEARTLVLRSHRQAAPNDSQLEAVRRFLDRTPS